MRSEARVVVIGGDVAGCSLLCQLTRLGWSYNLMKLLRYSLMKLLRYSLDLLRAAPTGRWIRYLPAAALEPGTELEVKILGERRAARVVDPIRPRKRAPSRVVW